MMTKNAGHNERRIAKRVPLNLASRLRYNGFLQGDLTIKDLSFTGVQCETEVTLKQGDLISVSLPNIGLVRATVKWCRGNNIAAEFMSPVDVRACFR